MPCQLADLMPVTRHDEPHTVRQTLIVRVPGPINVTSRIRYNALHVQCNVPVLLINYGNLKNTPGIHCLSITYPHNYYRYMLRLA